MRRVKNILRKYAPSAYKGLCAAKDYFFLERWGNYYDAVGGKLKLPEPSLMEHFEKVPAHVTTVLNIGCGSGRDFIPFDGRLALWGVDIVPGQRIRWVRDFKNLKYEHCSIEDLTRRLESADADMRHVLVVSNGALMYVSREFQRRFFGACLANGCRNFIIKEFPPDSEIYPNDNLRIHTNLFEAKPAGDGSHVFTLLEKR